ncbi:negative regulation of acetylcholine secretion [Mactra antiquata]
MKPRLFAGYELENGSVFVTHHGVIRLDSGLKIVDENVQVRIENIVTGVVLFLLIFLTIAGNLMVFVAVIYNKQLRTISNVFIVSLSVADFLLGTVVMIPAALNEIFHRWVLARRFCVVWAGFDVMLCSASILNVCLISFDRYIAIMLPLRYKVLITCRRSLLMLTIAWGIPIAASFIPLFSGIHNPDFPSLINLTLLTQTPQCLFVPSLLYVLVASTVTILLPMIVAFVLYYRVLKVAKRQACFLGVILTPTNMLLGAKVAHKHIREPFTRKATITLGIIVGAYVATWTPFLVVNIVDAACRCVAPRLFSAFVWLGYCNSLINPIIYPFFMRDFRKVYSKAIMKRFPCCVKPFSFKNELIYCKDPVENGTAKSNYENPV